MSAFLEETCRERVILEIGVHLAPLGDLSSIRHLVSHRVKDSNKNKNIGCFAIWGNQKVWSIAPNLIQVQFPSWFNANWWCYLGKTLESIINLGSFPIRGRGFWHSELGLKSPQVLHLVTLVITLNDVPSLEGGGAEFGSMLQAKDPPSSP